MSSRSSINFHDHFRHLVKISAGMPGNTKWAKWGEKNGKGKNSQWFGVIHRHWNNCGLYAKEIKWKDGNITQELECMLKTNGNPKNGKNKIAN